MHFKIAVILCAVYFVTSAWSEGLTDRQIKAVQEMYKQHKNSPGSNLEEKILQLMADNGIENPLFRYNSELKEFDNLKRVLMGLAIDNIVTFGGFKDDRVLSRTEVKRYVEIFDETDKDKDGVITVKECTDFIEDSGFAMRTPLPGRRKGLKTSWKATRRFAESFKDGINIADFMEIMSYWGKDIEAQVGYKRGSSSTSTSATP